MLGETLRRRHRTTGKDTSAGRGRLEARVVTWARWLGFAAGVVVASFVIGYGLAIWVMFPAPAEAAAGVVVPDLVSRARADAEREVAAVELRLAEPTLLHSPADSGTVIAQTPLPGQQLREGAAVQLVLSAGPAPVRVPPVRGMDHEQARALLEELGFEVSRRQETAALPAGRVVATRPGPGTAMHPPAQVLLTVSAGPPVRLEPGRDTLPFDVLRPDTSTDGRP